MTGDIIRHEWRTLRRDKTLPVIALILAAAVGYGVHNGAAWVRFQNETLRATEIEEEERLGGIKQTILDAKAGKVDPSGFSDPRSPATVGRGLGVRYARMPPAPLASLATGQSDLYPYYLKVSTEGKDTFLNNEEIEHPVHLLSGRFDLSFVVLFLYPLVILAMSYNLLSEERESGTLLIALSQPVSLSTLVCGKIATRFAFVFALAMGLPIAGVVAGGADLTAAGSLERLLLWIAIVAAYGAFWFALAVLVNASGKSSATNAVVLAGTWLVLVLILPAVLSVVVKVLHPVPSRVEMINAIRAASREASERGSALLGRYLEDHPELADAGVNTEDFAGISFVTQEEVERQVRPVLAKFDLALERQEAIVSRYRFLSPAILTQSALNDIGGTGVERYRHFLAMVDQFHETWRAWFIPRVVKREKLEATDINQLPVFEFREEPVSRVLQRGMTFLLGLVLPTLLLAGLSFAALRRFPVSG
jgi:ABC-2 type transport system permease protein